MQLESCVAWEKSIMKANCQFCGSGDNEASLLLCDACDKGYHTYCFKPNEMIVPPGDWFCFECINSVNQLNKVCVVCGKPGNTKMAQCDLCPKLFHPPCVGLQKVPPKKWTCVACTVPPALTGNGGTNNSGSGDTPAADGEQPPAPKKRSSSSK